MRRRVHKPGIEIRPVSRSARLVTLDDPALGTNEAQGAFARLRPAEGLTAEEVSSWRESVARVALAVRVVAQPRSALVPAASERSDAAPAGTLREEATALAAETEDTDVVALVGRVLDEVGA